MNRVDGGRRGYLRERPPRKERKHRRISDGTRIMLSSTGGD